MKNILQDFFDFQITSIEKLNGYDNANYLIKTADAKYIFKTYNYSEKLLDLIKAENQTLQFLQVKPNNKYPKPIPFKDGSTIKVTQLNGKKTISRLLSFLEGTFLGDCKHTPKLFTSFGQFLAKTDLKLKLYTNYVLQSRKWEWDIQYLHLNEKYIEAIPIISDRNIVRYFFQQFKENVTPILSDLRKSIIHNDANEWNTLVNNEKVTGFIDFGDLAYTPLINELAIAITYACFEKEDPLKWAVFIIKAYHKTIPLKEQELNILYYLIAARLCTSICNSAHARKINPNNTYASTSEKPAWKMLRLWLEINPIKAKNTFLATVGFKIQKPETIENSIKRRHKVISNILALSYDEPLHIKSAAFQYMYDAFGNTFLDAYNNIPHVGHSHPSIVIAGQKQLAKLNTNTRYVYDLLAEYGEKLLSKFPNSLSKVYFVNSGSAASDLAIRIAYAHSEHKKIMVMEHGYHGNTQIATDISDYKFNNKKDKGKKIMFSKQQFQIHIEENIL